MDDNGEIYFLKSQKNQHLDIHPSHHNLIYNLEFKLQALYNIIHYSQKVRDKTWQATVRMQYRGSSRRGRQTDAPDTVKNDEGTMRFLV